MIRGVRGATTADHNTKEAIVEASHEMLEALIEANEIDPDDIAAAIFSTTSDLNAEFPTVAARRMGWTEVALMNTHEMAVPDAQPQCIRVLVLLNTDKSPREIRNIYLKGAIHLRARGMEDK
jgi:chorismate mutase